MSRANEPARRIIELGEKGFRISEVLETLKSEIKATDILSFIEEMSSQGLICLSPLPKSPLHEEKVLPKLDFLWIEVTSKCNLRCIHCYNESEFQKNTGYSTEELKQLMDEATALGCKMLQLTGGECTLRNDLYELLRYARFKEFEFIEVFTNGTLLTEEMVRFFAKEGIAVALSIYSYRAEIHDIITRVPGSFQKTLNSLKLLIAYGVSTRCCVTALKQNEEDLDGTSNFLCQLGVLNSSPDLVKPIGRGRSMENWPLKYGFRSIQTQPSFSISREAYEKNLQWNSCWYGKAVITSEGDVLPCVFARDLVAGNVTKQSLKEIILGKKMQSFWSLNSDKIETCRDCEYRYLCDDCRPWAFGTTRNLYAKSPRCAYDPYKGEWGIGVISKKPELEPFDPSKEISTYSRCSPNYLCGENIPVLTLESQKELDKKAEKIKEDIKALRKSYKSL